MGSNPILRFLLNTKRGIEMFDTLKYFECKDRDEINKILHEKDIWPCEVTAIVWKDNHYEVFYESFED